ncbi:MAG: hypothetical protein AB1540_16715, partial [Bdellovibrionota bacterium]
MKRCKWVSQFFLSLALAGVAFLGGSCGGTPATSSSAPAVESASDRDALNLPSTEANPTNLSVDDQTQDQASETSSEPATQQPDTPTPSSEPPAGKNNDSVCENPIPVEQPGLNEITEAEIWQGEIASSTLHLQSMALFVQSVKNREISASAFARFQPGVTLPIETAVACNKTTSKHGFSVSYVAPIWATKQKVASEKRKHWLKLIRSEQAANRDAILQHRAELVSPDSFDAFSSELDLSAPNEESDSEDSTPNSEIMRIYRLSETQIEVRILQE